MLPPQMPRTVDRSLARMIAYKRLLTGSMAIIAGFVCLGVMQSHGGPMSAPMLVALVIFFLGGGWTLRDGLRLRRELGR